MHETSTWSPTATVVRRRRSPRRCRRPRGRGSSPVTQGRRPSGCAGRFRRSSRPRCGRWRPSARRCRVRHGVPGAFTRPVIDERLHRRSAAAPGGCARTRPVTMPRRRKPRGAVSTTDAPRTSRRRPHGLEPASLGADRIGGAARPRCWDRATDSSIDRVRRDLRRTRQGLRVVISFPAAPTESPPSPGARVTRHARGRMAVRNARPRPRAS